LHTQLSPRAGEKGSNRFSLGLAPAVKAAFIGATIMLSPTIANANDGANNTASPTTYSASLTAPQTKEVWQKAKDHSRENVEIAIVVYGHTAKYTPEQLGEGFQKVFAREGVNETSVWTANAEQRGAKVLFIIDGTLTSDNILNLKEVMPHIPEAAQMFKEHAPLMRQRMASAGDFTVTPTSLEAKLP